MASVEHLRVGSQVVIEAHYNSFVGVITGETPTRWKVGNESYRKSDGYRVGSEGWHRSHIREAAPGDLEAYEKREIVRRLKDINPKTLEALPLSRLKEIEALLKP